MHNILNDIDIHELNKIDLDTEYKKQAIEELITYAGFWDYDADEQKDESYTRRRKFLALTQLEATKLIIDNNLIENNLIFVGLIALIENNYQEDGSILIPVALRPYMGGKDKIMPKQK